MPLRLFLLPSGLIYSKTNVSSRVVSATCDKLASIAISIAMLTNAFTTIRQRNSTAHCNVDVGYRQSRMERAISRFRQPTYTCAKDPETMLDKRYDRHNHRIVLG